jgi:hypothetical protein
MPYYSSILDVCVPEDEVPAGMHAFSDVSRLYSEKQPATRRGGHLDGTDA